jgi:beta-mannanase
VQFDHQVLEEYRTSGIMPGLTWNPSKGPIELYTDRQVAINQTDFSWKQIVSGKHDSYITQFAKDAAAYQYPFILRILHEMGGTWYPWGYSVNGNTNPADYVTAWTHIVDIFRKENATNVQFVWCPSVLSPDLIQRYGAILRQVYPGDNYVDWIALDGYSNSDNGWRSLQDEFKPSYDFIVGFSARPMILFEVGAMVNAADPMAQANWIRQGFLTTIPNQLPKVKVAVWFNSKDGQGRDYRLQTSPNTIAAWKQVVASPLYQGSLIK